MVLLRLVMLLLVLTSVLLRVLRGWLVLAARSRQLAQLLLDHVHE
jgi:hypothetical protein